MAENRTKCPFCSYMVSDSTDYHTQIREHRCFCRGVGPRPNYHECRYCGDEILPSDPSYAAFATEHAGRHGAIGNVMKDPEAARRSFAIELQARRASQHETSTKHRQKLPNWLTEPTLKGWAVGLLIIAGFVLLFYLHAKFVPPQHCDNPESLSTETCVEP